MKLLKTIKRELFLTSQEGKHRGLPIVLELLPGDLLSFRIKGTRERVEVSLGHCYNLARKFSLEKRYAQEMKDYKEKKQQGKRPRTPKRPFIPFNPKLYSR